MCPMCLVEFVSLWTLHVARFALCCALSESLVTNAACVPKDYMDGAPFSTIAL